MNFLLVFLAAFVGSGLKAIGGFGFATLTTPAVAIFWSVPTAIAVISVPTLLTSLLNGWRTRSAAAEGLGPFAPFFLAGLAGLALGLTVLFNADARLMKFFLGAFLIGQVLWQWTHPESAKPPGASPLRGIGMGLLAGVMLGTVGMPSHVIAAYLTGLNLSKTRYLFVLSAAQVILRAAVIASLLAAGAFSRDSLLLIAAVTIPVFSGFFMGTLLFARLPERAFFRAVTAALLAMAVSLVAANWSVLLAS
ncbi:MAG: TSUP family transporter [Nitrospinota bacterium]|jgi:hypothetical protein|nr:hypothetical protein [Nitrospinota bacterium]MDP6366132.1 TSUP family transporter [Nitrospinota bacterium]